MNVPEKVILLVEDNPIDEKLTLRSLNKGRLLNKIHVVRDGEEALEYLFGADNDAGGTDHLPQLILLDLKIPKVSGIEVLRKVREDPRTRLVPVVVLTSSDEGLDVSTCYEIGANSFVKKPVNFEDFEKAVGEIGLYWLVVNILPAAEGAPEKLSD